MCKSSAPLFLFSLCVATFTSANDALPLGTILDSQGNPISLPKKEQSSLEFSAEDLIKDAETSKKSSNSYHRSNKRKTGQLTAKKVPRKKYSASKMANDPSCRWLKARINKLKSGLKNSSNTSNNSYHQRELTVRNEEWRCLKCATQGPSIGDYDRCQYKR